MCKILSSEKKSVIKKFQNKKILAKKVTGQNNVISRDIDISLYTISEFYQDDEGFYRNEIESCNENNALCKREKSRIAAKKRRNQENENLSELYISLPVATQSKLLSCYDNQFVGNFEKATIIKISAFVLKLYNSLSDVLFDNSFQFDKHPFVSLFSQSIFGLFWCEKTKKLIFSSPGLARLTGLYWCNMIGMPQSSIIVECGNLDSSNMIFLRFMMGALKDKGIFTVNPQKFGNNKQTEETKVEKGQTMFNQTKRDFIGKLPCTVWCSQTLPNGITFDLIQPLIIKSDNLFHGNQFPQSYQLCPYRLPIFNDIHSTETKRTGHNFTSYHYIDSLNTMSIIGDFYNSLGYPMEDFSKSSLLSFFHFDDIVQVSKHATEVISGQKKIQVGIARLCTPKIDVYRWCRYILQVNSIKEISESNFKSHRSSVSQGESYSQNFVRISSTLSQYKNDSVEFQENMENCWLEASFFLCHNFKEYQSDFASILKNDISFKTFTTQDCREQSSMQKVRHFLQSDSPNNLYEKSNWIDESSSPVEIPFDLNYNQKMYTDEKKFNYYSQDYRKQDSILLKELMRPVQNFC